MALESEKKIKILGISAFYHDSAAALVIDGRIVAATQEERFTRKKHDDSFPKNAVQYVLGEYGLSVSDLDAVVFYDKPYLKFERLLETYHMIAPKGVASFLMAIVSWIKEKLFTRQNIWKDLETVEGRKILKRPPLLFCEHHLSHAASAFYPSPFESAAILTIDGVGEWATTTICYGAKEKISNIKEIHFPHSVGLFYSAFTYYCGFKVNSGEYKLMGLAPYGDRGSERVNLYKKLITTDLVNIKFDGSIALNMEYFDFAHSLRMCNDSKWEDLFKIRFRSEEDELTQEYCDLALAAQEVIEEIVTKLATTAKKLTNSENLVMAGGVALNCVANSKILEQKIFRNIWIQPSAGDAGGALGAALSAYYIYFGKSRSLKDSPLTSTNMTDGMSDSFLGPEFSSIDVIKVANKYGAPFKKFDSLDSLCVEVSEIISQCNVVGWVQGRMEWGPRALGNRSILGDARNPEMQKKLNIKIKSREGFRPFAPSVLEEDTKDYFDFEGKSPYMLFTAPVQNRRRKPIKTNTKDIYERLYSPRSDIPAVTHMDYSARLQTVSKKTNERFWTLLNTFKQKFGFGILINTSFNVRGEPIVCTPEDAYRCFMNTQMDYLVIGDFLFEKKEQPKNFSFTQNKYEKD